MSGNNNNKWTATPNGTAYLDLNTPTKSEQASSANNWKTTPNGTVDLLSGDDDRDLDADAYSKECQTTKRGIRTAGLENGDERSKKAAAAAAAPSLHPRRVSASPPPIANNNNTPPKSPRKTGIQRTTNGTDVAVANEDDFEEGRGKEVRLLGAERGRRVGGETTETIEEDNRDVEESNTEQVRAGGLKNDADYETDEEGEGAVADAVGAAPAGTTKTSTSFKTYVFHDPEETSTEGPWTVPKDTSGNKERFSNMISDFNRLRLEEGNDSQYNEDPNREANSVWEPSNDGEDLFTLRDGSCVNIHNSVPSIKSNIQARGSALMEIQILSLVDPNTHTVVYCCPFEVETGESVGQVFRDMNDTVFHGELQHLNKYNSEYGHPALLARVEDGSPRFGKRFLTFVVTTGTASVEGYFDLGWNHEAEEEMEHLRGIATHWTQAQLISPMLIARRNTQNTQVIAPMYDLQDQLLGIPRGDTSVSPLVAVADVLIRALPSLFGVPPDVTAHRRRNAVGGGANNQAVGRRVEMNFDGIGMFGFRVENARDCDIKPLACWCYCVVKILHEMGYRLLDSNHNYVHVMILLINGVTGEVLDRVVNNEQEPIPAQPQNQPGRMLQYTQPIGQLRNECSYAIENSIYRNRLDDTTRGIFDIMLECLERIPNQIRNDLLVEATILNSLREEISNARRLCGIPDGVILALGTTEPILASFNVTQATHGLKFTVRGTWSIKFVTSHSAQKAAMKKVLSPVMNLTGELYKELLEEDRVRFRRFIAALWNDDDGNFQDLANAIMFPVEEGEAN